MDQGDDIGVIRKVKAPKTFIHSVVTLHDVVAANRPATQDEIYRGVAKHSSEDSGMKVGDMVVIKCSVKEDEACGVLLREIGILECQHGGLHCPLIGFHKNMTLNFGKINGTSVPFFLWPSQGPFLQSPS